MGHAHFFAGVKESMYFAESHAQYTHSCLVSTAYSINWGAVH